MVVVMTAAVVVVAVESSLNLRIPLLQVLTIQSLSAEAALQALAITQMA